MRNGYGIDEVLGPDFPVGRPLRRLLLRSPAGWRDFS